MQISIYKYSHIFLKSSPHGGLPYFADWLLSFEKPILAAKQV